MRLNDHRQPFDLTETLAAVAQFLETAGRGSPRHLVTADSVDGPGSVAASVEDEAGSRYLLIRVVPEGCEFVRELTEDDHAALAFEGDCDPERVGE